jgi:hypothetical protein
MSWTNADGLTVLMHEEQGAVQTTGLHAGTTRKTLVVDLEDATTLGSSVGSIGAAGPNDAFIPSGAIIIKAWFVVDTAFTSGGSATLNIGLFQQDGTEIDADGLDATVAVATLVADAVVEGDGADVGTRVGANDAYIGFIYSTAAFTAGAGKLIVEYIEV